MKKKKIRRLLTNFSIGLGIVIAVLSFVISYYTFREMKTDSFKEDQIDIDAYLDKAWDLFGGKPGSSIIDSLNTNCYELEIARRYIAKALVISPENMRAKKYLAVYYEAIDEFNKSISTIDELQKLYPNDYSISIYKGITFLKDSSYEEAIDCFNYAVKIDPTNYISYINLANTYRLLEKNQKADSLFNIVDSMKLNDFIRKKDWRIGTYLRPNKYIRPNSKKNK